MRPDSAAPSLIKRAGAVDRLAEQSLAPASGPSAP
jgi:hypothetical protein